MLDNLILTVAGVNPQETDTKKNSIEKQMISRIVHARLCVIKIWYKSNSIIPPDEFTLLF